MYKTKNEFLTGLEKELGRAGITDKSEIIADFELHFADSTAQGLSEAEICAKLGSISEIAKQYAEDEIYPVVAVESQPQEEPQPTHFSTEDIPPPSPQQEYNQAYADYENSGIKINLFGKRNRQTAGSNNAARPRENIPPPDYQNNYNYNNYGSFNAGGLIAVICVDIFILVWAIPALFGIMVAFLAVPFALVVLGITTMIGGVFGASFANFFSPLPGVVTFFVGLMLLSLGGLFALLGAAFVKLFVKVIKCVIDWHGNMIVGRPVFKKQEVSA
ncbi:MAG: DUF1700 domain-containing protein [Oscillospiraceae bacterium]|jgi:uncharacterized membrane protein|nr:DUF1700 domain-containing protein [Oscillospiraceae bacterium]